MHPADKTFSVDSSIGALYRHPAGNDIVEKLLLQTGAPKRLLLNPITKNLRLGALQYLSLGRIDRGFLDALVSLLNEQPQEVAPIDTMLDQQWWHDTVIYQIYPRSFQDSNGDGIGDLAGITSRLDYLERLGVGAIWLSPIFDSPNDDMGYDIRDYRRIMDEFGNLDDFDDLVKQTHSRGIRVILDLVVNHTSDEHRWFRDALENEDSPFRDYYFFVKGSPDQPPNNWSSFFSGPAWRYYEEQGLWALHLFSSKQMDLNWDNPAVRQEVADIADFWVNRGVDGFRLDVINYISKRSGLPDGNQLIGEVMGFSGVEHYFLGPHLHEYLAELNERSFAPKGIFSVGETPGIGHMVGKQITDPERKELDLIFNFDHLETTGHTRQDDYRYDLNYLKDYYTTAMSEYRGQYWMSLFLENHDNPRMVSKVNPDPRWRIPLAKLIGGTLLTLRGTPFLFQGQELGMVNQDFKSIADLRDVEALNAYEEAIQFEEPDQVFRDLLAGTRDHARTPMQWSGEQWAGFSPAKPWLVGDQDYLEFNAEAEESDPDSVLEFYRSLISWRNGHKNVVLDDIEFCDLNVHDYWVYLRGKRHLVQMNLSCEPLNLPGDLTSIGLVASAQLLLSNRPYDPEYPVDPGQLAPYEWRLWEL